MGVTRRRLLALGAGVAGVAAVPTGLHLTWGARDFTRDTYDPDWPVAEPGRAAWMNWSGIARATPETIAAPETEDALAGLIAGGRGRIRPVGSGHSFSPLVPTGGILVDVSNLSGLIEHDAAARRVTFGAGTRLGQAARAMADIGLAWPNQPDIDVQTLAGSFATATHGTGLTLPAIHDAVSGFRIILASGEVRDVTADSDPDLFSAGLVSLGTLGIITRYTLDVVPAYALRRRVFVEPLEAMLEAAEARAEAHRNFEFFYFPHTGLAAGISHDRHEGPVSGLEPAGEDTLLADLKMARDTFGWWPWLRRRLVASGFPQGEIEDVSGEAWRMLSTTRPVKFNEMEYHLPREAGLSALREVIARLERRRDTYFPLEVRWTAADEAMLSPFQGGPRMSIATHADVAEPYDYLFRDIEPVHLAHGGRPHWGKLHGLSRDALAALYPRYDDFADLRRSLDPDERFLNRYLARLFGGNGDA